MNATPSQGIELTEHYPSSNSKHSKTIDGKRGKSTDDRGTDVANAAHAVEGVSQAVPGISTTKLSLILLALWLGVLLAALDQSMLATISATIASSFNAFSSLSWMTTVLPIGASITQPVSGQLTEIFGRQWGLVLGLSALAVGTLMCGLSPVLWLFLLGRGIQGLGVGAITTITAYVETDVVPIRNRALIEGIGNVFYGIVLATGGIYGGAVQSSLGWKWVFFIQVPVIAFDILLVIFLLNTPRARSPDNTPTIRRIDFVGMASLLASLILLQFGLKIGSTSHYWNSTGVIIPLILSVVCFAGFIWWELCQARFPLVSIKALMQRTVALMELSGGLAMLGYIVILFYVPIYLQALGNNTTQSALRFIPLAVCFALGSFATGAIVSKTARYYWVNLAVQIFAVGGAGLLCSLTKNTPAYALFIYMAVYGIGSGGAFVTRLMGVLSSVKKERQTEAQAAMWVINNTGQTLGLAIGAAIFQHSSIARLQEVLGNRAQQYEQDFEAGKNLGADAKASVASIYVHATRMAFVLAAVATGISAIASFCAENNRIGNMDSTNANADMEEEQK